MEQKLFTEEEINQAFNKSIELFSSIDKIDMTRMQGQIDVARKVIHAYYLNNKRNVVIEAPTGFGKSILAFFITDVICNLTDSEEQSYILTSSKMLQNQYNRDIEAFGLVSRYVLLKGQGNYQCSANNEPFFKRECTGISLSKIELEKDFRECSQTCQYLLKRKAAMSAETTVFNYAYWLTTMNMVYANIGPDNAPFVPRELTIFDECHLVGDMVQNMFSNEINVDYTLRLAENLYKMQSFVYNKAEPIDEALADIRRQVYKIDSIQDSTDFETQYDAIIDLTKNFSVIKSAFGKIKKKLLDKSTAGERPSLTDDQKRFATFADIIDEITGGLIELTNLYKEIGLDSIVITVEERKKSGKKDTDLILKLQCTDESSMVQRKLINYTTKGLYMSATIGDIDNYCKQMGIEDYEKIYVDSDFDFEPSRIYEIVPQLKMSYRFKRENMPKMMNYIRTILEHHKDERGIIHTGNYEFMNRIKQDINDPRLIIYSNAGEKDEALRKLEETPNGVLCGPSILEGVDLKDDLARFMMFMKVPYKSLADKLTKRKMDKYEGWYDWLTMTSFLQGLGRPIRHKKDYATTYLLDGSFGWFLKKNKLRQYQKDRMHSCSITKLGASTEEEFNKALDNLIL